ncbi:hypothetical protein BASA82_001259, partial [Batrachochytrium salamandrivorans]
MDSIQTPAQDSRLYIKREVSGEHSGTAVMRPYVNDNSPSQTTIVQWVDPSYGPNSNAVASMQIKASVPSVSLDNLDGLDSITCSGSLVTVSLKSVTDVLTWKDDNILLIIGSHHHCGPDHTDVITMLLAFLLWQVRVNPDQSEDRGHQGLEKRQSGTVPGVLDVTSKLSINACTDKELRDQAVNLPGIISSFSKLHAQV